MAAAHSPEIYGPEEDVREQQFSGDALAALNKSEIAQQIEIARKYPRSIDKFRSRLDAMATVSQQVALTMFYSLPRGNKQVLGPGVRFAEALITAWGNARAGVRLLGVEGNFFIAQGVFFDCETNVGISIEAQRRVTDKNGQRFNDDMIGVTGNAAASIAYRNAIFRGVPKALWNDLYERAKVVAAGDAKSLNAQINEAIETFRKLGITDVMVLNTLGVQSLRDLTGEHLVTMRVLYKDVAGGDKTIEDVFGSPLDAEIEALMDQLQWSTAKRRMAWDGHKGRREELLAYMRAQVSAAGGSGEKVATMPAKADKAAEPAKEQPQSTNGHAPAVETKAETASAEQPATAKPTPRKAQPSW